MLQQATGLCFTVERSKNGTMPFLDVLVEQQEPSFGTTVYVKDSDLGHCLNGVSECPQRYKDSTIGAYIRRALTHCSNWTLVHQEIERVSQLLANNGFKNRDIQRITKRVIDKYHMKDEEDPSSSEDIKIYYRAVFSNAYREDERIMKQIINRNVKPTNPEDRINFIIYYKSKRTSQFLLRNSPQQEKDVLQCSHVVYRFTCNRGNCAALPSSYIGMTTVKLADRLANHKYNGAPKQHLQQEHNINITKDDLQSNTEVLISCSDPKRLPILEALYIKELKPSLNVQALDLQVLPSMRRCPPEDTLPPSSKPH